MTSKAHLGGIALLLTLAVAVGCGDSASNGGNGGSGAGAQSGAAAAGSAGAGAQSGVGNGGTVAGTGASSGAGSGGVAGGNAAGTAGTDVGGNVDAGADAGGAAGEGGAGGSSCLPQPTKPVACADAIEGNFIGRFSVTAEDNAASTLSEVTGPSGAKALRLITASGFLVTLRFDPVTPLSAQATDELRVLVRALNDNTGWQGNVPAFTLEDSQGKRRTYTPPGALFPSDGTTWVDLRVPLAGGQGYTVTGDTIDFAHVRAVELTADTWEAGYTIDFDGLGFVAPGATCAASCPADCSGRGACDSGKLGCVCEVGASGEDCKACRAGFSLKAGHCALDNDADYDHWPNPVSKTNGDAWLQAHHEQIVTIKPRVLALNFVNKSVPENVETLVGDVIAGFREGSKPLGAQQQGVLPGLDYELVDVVDLRDGVNGRPAPPQNYAYENSTLYPRRPQGQAGAWSFDYAELFGKAFAKYYGFEDPKAPGTYLDLCTLIESGELNELWVVGSGDVPDANAAEVLESKQRYDAGRNPLPGNFEHCAGNGCFDADVPHCARSVRIGWVNYNRGPGCYLHSHGHGIESAARRQVVPPLSDWFLPLAGFDLDKRYGLPGQSFYEMLGNANHAEYPSSSELNVVIGGQTTHVANYVASCGNVHFPPNANNHYDYASTVEVMSDCADFGRNVAECRPRAAKPVAYADWSGYEQLAPDCGGAFMVYWYQHMPGYGSGQRFDDGRKMLSVWPFLFY